ncbi:MAG: DNA gyrase inhibitor YacG [Bradyrhizobium sp.]|uniref:DNA gyrase inhibitor YacG n=1 Tax=Bradyrhizobium sp. TaxID=376 RepID=UPI002394957C|nr:DNA gyrase inhibitor YacG [Bradyrhizobium sp.]MDE2603189.1 DNA gyrase inhibitor YacG [Bradyrhizobium sp.]
MGTEKGSSPPDRAGSAGRPAQPSGKKPCPICGKPPTEASRPFCSDRCRDVDLNRWLSGSYAIPGKPEADEDAG